MDDYKIEKGVPLNSGNKLQNALQSMEVDDSLFVPKPMANFAGTLTHCRATYKDRKYVARTVDGGTRIWRTK